MAKKSESVKRVLHEFKITWQSAMAQLGAGKNAASYIAQMETELNGLHGLVGEATRLFEIARSANSAAGYRDGQISEVSTPRRKLSQDERSRVIKEVAIKTALHTGGETNVRAVAQAVKDQGVDLGTSVPGTMIGNVLNRSADWKRVDKGVFKYIGKAA